MLALLSLRLTAKALFGHSVEHLPVILFFAFLAYVLQSLATSVFSPLLRAYRELPEDVKEEWNLRVVHFGHSLVVSVCAIPVVMDGYMGENIRSRLLATSGSSDWLIAFATGFELFRLCTAVRYLFTYGLRHLLYVIVCFAAYFNALRGFANYYAVVFLLFELVTPFVNLTWFFEKAGDDNVVVRTNSTLMVFMFVAVRVVFGVYITLLFHRDMRWALRHPDLLDFPGFYPLSLVFLVMNLATHAANASWAVEMYRRGRLGSNRPADPRRPVMIRSTSAEGKRFGFGFGRAMSSHTLAEGGSVRKRRRRKDA